MGNQRKTGGRSELDAAWTQINLLVAEVTALRNAILASLDRGNNGLFSVDDLTAMIVDLGVLRTQIVNLLADVTGRNTKTQNQVVGADDLTAVVTDLGVIRTPVVALVVDVTARKARSENEVTGADALAAVVADLTALRTKLVNTIADVAARVPRIENEATSCAGLGSGSTAGKIATTIAISFRIAGALYAKAITDDLWDLSAEVDTDGTHFRAYWLYLDVNGAATIAAGTDATSAPLALAALPALAASKAVVGVFVANVSCDFNGIAGLAAQGTLYNGWPGALALAASTPAALTASATTGIANGTTPGAIKTQHDVEFKVNGTLYRKAATDDLWDLSAEVDTDGTHFRAYWLYLNSSGVASIAAGTDATSEALAIAALPALAADKAVIGVFVAGISCDFNAGGGLAAQGTYVNGWPSAQTITATSPAAVTASATCDIANGTTPGCLQARCDVEFQVNGALYRKPATDDLWDLSAEVDTGAAEYKATWLYLNASGTASIASGTAAASAAAAIAALPAIAADKAVIGVFVAGLSCDYNAGGGLSAQGTIYLGWAAAQALTATTPAAVSTSATLGIANGTTPGCLKTQADSVYAIAGTWYRKASTDDLWDLSAQTDTIAAQYKAFWLYVDAGGTATIAAGTVAASEAAAIAALPAEVSTKCPLGVFVAGPSCDFNGAGGLAAQGTIINGRAAAMADPSAQSSTATTLVSS
jgi:hypothetical protein